MNGYACRTVYLGSGKTTVVRMHMLIAGTPIGLLTDHINGDKLDNRKVNLRLCDHSQNQYNATIRRKGKSSKYRGVYLHKRDGRWYARIRVDGKKIHIGCFEIEEEAARAYDAAAQKHHGEFATLNFELPNLTTDWAILRDAPGYRNPCQPSTGNMNLARVTTDPDGRCGRGYGG